ncbi:MAG: hypothetical protein O2960_21170, partial [Verrucomicrobia bacterium]|nr:hypothetical protein [Verrucomicrobiota bacterium]
RTLDSHGPIRQPPTMEITASSFKLRANAPEGQKAISYQLKAPGGTNQKVFDQQLQKAEFEKSIAALRAHL